MSLDRVNAYVKEIGFDVAEKTGTWKDYTVYTPLFENKHGKRIPTGLPVLVLEKKGILKEVTGRKVFLICDEIFRQAKQPKKRYA
ncbi:hypothetical protein [Megasphaera massiliensis]|uniref:hypothetical protein n=1 Tax=Megasphaera massiliensis TaxID=1232428 RepID=UPI000413E80B|nr:hypothetical protein [Megasphaera massiliensis]MBS6256217.1 hypothetical protein [Megasphaera sp.]MCQ5209367.1 hypothetical protein [Megasphaera massiliensis]MEE0658888.1 hypothetical protein [Megasphaera massiliensis]